MSSEPDSSHDAMRTTDAAVPRIADCPLARTVEAIGPWWTLEILHEVLDGHTRFSAIRHHLELPADVLRERLADLVTRNLLIPAGPTDPITGAEPTDPVSAVAATDLHAAAGPTGLLSAAGSTDLPAAAEPTEPVTAAAPTDLHAAVGSTELLSAAGSTDLHAAAEPTDPVTAAAATDLYAAVGPTGLHAAAGRTAPVTGAAPTDLHAAVEPTASLTAAGPTGLVNSAEPANDPAYLPTARGAALRPLLLVMAAWGNHELVPQERSLIVVEAATGRAADPVVVDGRTGRRLDTTQYVFARGPRASAPIRARYPQYPQA
ncbi:hypothetical protein ACIO3O_29295 [Streptomyces sp. NPDC087440]|uniref:winged helix-turn-helix transcriptional regulator n=1 Tax=Streptomyces sp. NPDC087440 TaxID=3365790 RepID=UPI0037F1D03E